MKKRILALALCAVLCLQMFPVHAIALTGESAEAPACDCGNTQADLSAHSDVCARKAYCRTASQETAQVIYAAWDGYDADVQSFILTYLGWTDQAKLAELNGLIENSAEDRTVSAAVGSSSVSASGTMSGSAVLAAENGSEEKSSFVTGSLIDLSEAAASASYAYDISLAGSYTGSVTLSVGGIPSLGEYEQIYIVHLLDSAQAIAAGNATAYTAGGLSDIFPEETAASGSADTIYYEVLSASRDDDGNVVFTTDSFSEFIIYTVVFQYHDYDFTIPGGSGVLLSELFEQLGIEREVSSVTSVDFTDYDLISVEKEGDDWRLVSLQSFTTEEKLTVSFDDGTALEIVVLDDTNSEELGTGSGGTSRSIFHDMRASGIYANYTEWGGLYSCKWYLYEGDTNTRLSTTESPAWRIATSVHFAIRSEDYYFTVSSTRNIKYTDDNVSTMKFGVIAAKAEVTFRRYSTLVYSNSGYCTVKQATKLVEVGDVQSRRVVIYADGTKISDQYLNFPNRPEDELLVSDLTVSNLASPYYKSAVSIEDGHYRVDLTSRYTVSGSVSGSNATASPASQYVDYGKNGSVTFTANTGYLIDYITDNGTKKDIANAASYTYTVSNVTANRTIIAYTTPVSYTITYDLGGGKVSTANPTSYNIETASFTLNNPTRDGYKFLGWTGSNGTTAQTTVSIAKGSTGNKSYTANWEISNYTVTYDANGGSGAPGSQTKTYGAALTLSSTKPTRTGYTFSGWNTAANGSGTSYAVGASYTANASVTLYAQWKALYRYELKFDANAGTDTVSGMPVDQSQAWGESASHTFTWTAVPSRAGYTFRGWAAAADGTPSRIQSYTLTGTGGQTVSATLYAIWQEDTVTIRYVAQGNGSVDGVSERSETVNAKTGTPAGAAASADQGFKLVGWYNEKGVLVSADAKFVPQKNGSGLYEAGTYYARFQRERGELKIAPSGNLDQPVIVHITGPDGTDMTVVVSDGEGVTISGLPTGTYSVAAEAWGGSTTVSVSDESPEVKADQTTTVTFTCSAGSSWFSAVHWITNLFGKA